MNPSLSKLTHSYRTALRSLLQPERKIDLDSVRKLAAEASAAGVQAPDLARLHEQILVTEILPACPPRKRASLIRRAGTFFAIAVTPDAMPPGAGPEVASHLKKVIEALNRRTLELAASNQQLQVKNAQLREAEEALKKSEKHYAQQLTRSKLLQQQLHHLSRQVLTAQEEERKRISRDLHDIIAQTLTGINLLLAALKKEAHISPKNLERNIERTQRLVEKSVDIVHRFARELRPPVLDDLGLIPALHALMKNFSADTGVQARLTAAAAAEHLATASKTILFRVAQEALTNVGRHARASEVEVRIEKRVDQVWMGISDDGKSFQAEKLLLSRSGKRLGLLGMRERLEMAGGSFGIDSSPGRGTTIEATIPLQPPSRMRERKSPEPSTEPS